MKSMSRSYILSPIVKIMRRWLESHASRFNRREHKKKKKKKKKNIPWREAEYRAVVWKFPAQNKNGNECGVYRAAFLHLQSVLPQINLSIYIFFFKTISMSLVGAVKFRIKQLLIKWKKGGITSIYKQSETHVPDRGS